jgi:molecular chaperone DnaK
LTPPGDWVLAIDFGTTNTVAAVGDAGGVRTLNIDGHTIMPSAVLLKEGMLGQRESWVVGEHAVNQANTRLRWFERNPKYRIGDEFLLLGDRRVRVVDVVAEVLRVVVNEAAKTQPSGPPAAYVVTHPAGWPEAKIKALKQAAGKAAEQHRGWPEPEAVPEPQAAAQRTLGLSGVSEEARMVVLDLGGGTVDAAIVDRTGPALTLVGQPLGMQGAGGEDFDFRLAEWMTNECGVREPFRRLAVSGDVDEREWAYETRKLARSVKEQLSRNPLVPVQLPKSPPGLNGNVSVQVPRPQFEQLIRGGSRPPPGLTEAVQLVSRILENKPTGPPFAGVFLVGGSSRIPLLGQLVQEQVERTPIEGGDPGTAVADGAAAYARGRLLAPTNGGPGSGTGIRTDGKEGTDDGAVEGTGTGVDSILPLRTVLTALVSVLVLVGGVVGVYLWQHGNRDVPENNNTTTSVVTQTAVAPPPSPTPAHGVGDLLLAGCPSPDNGDCAQRVLAASRAAWPAMPFTDCTTRGPLYSTDRYSAQCGTNGTYYLVFWRSSGLLAPALVNQMLMPTLRDFVLPNSTAKLGSQAFGTRPTTSGQRFTCVWEYADYPVTMVIDGPNDNTTLSLCGTVTFLDPAQLDSVVEPG